MDIVFKRSLLDKIRKQLLSGNRCTLYLKGSRVCIKKSKHDWVSPFTRPEVQAKAQAVRKIKMEQKDDKTT